MEQALVDLVTDGPAGKIVMDRKQEIELEVTRRTLEAAKGKIDFLWMGEDLGTQDRPMISLELYRQQIRPRHEPFLELARSHNLQVMFHTCGASSFAYDDFIDTGISAVEALQPEASEMAPASLKKRFGDRLAFHGCISTAGNMTYGTAEDVTREVRETLETMMPGGGYCLAPAHMFQDNTPTENVVAMYEAAHRYGHNAS